LRVAGRRARLLGQDLELAVQTLSLDERGQGRAALTVRDLTTVSAVAWRRAGLARLADLGDLLPAGDEPHPPARAITIGRRRQRRHGCLVGAGLGLPWFGGRARLGV